MWLAAPLTFSCFRSIDNWEFSKFVTSAFLSPNFTFKWILSADHAACFSSISSFVTHQFYLPQNTRTQTQCSQVLSHFMARCHIPSSPNRTSPFCFWGLTRMAPPVCISTSILFRGTWVFTGKSEAFSTVRPPTPVLPGLSQEPTKLYTHNNSGWSWHAPPHSCSLYLFPNSKAASTVLGVS